MNVDTRVGYGARCTWWDDIHHVRKSNDPGGIGVPSCPHCGGVLFEYPDEATWFAAVDKFEAAGNPGYRALIEWARGKCFRHWTDVRAAYEAERRK